MGRNNDACRGYSFIRLPTDQMCLNKEKRSFRRNFPRYKWLN